MEENTLSYDIGTRIAEIRRSHNVTQEALSEMLDISRQHLASVEAPRSTSATQNVAHQAYPSKI